MKNKTLKRKSLHPNQTNIKKAKRILDSGAKAGTIDQALNLVTFQKDLLDSLAKVGRKVNIAFP